ncbi:MULTISPECIES: major capsid protein [unclassified Clostridioides]|uniref:major capsid protein n=1 Tax=unclassified Clostridioides TaxID=2635829 RepID=UPI001D0C3951|nr:major capsid protein [Clostridioides sp. ES-S-0001-03]MCC0670484.1 major capsid protein [Clostridioides sp. ES-S-0145-01]
MARIDEVFNTKELINYFKKREFPEMLGAKLFPERKIQDIRFDMILGKSGLPVSAEIHAMDTETTIASREAIDKGAAELALVKRKIALRGEDLIRIQSPRNDAEFKLALQEIYNDAEKMYKAVLVKAEAMRMEVLATGKLKIEENNIKVTLNYGIPNSNVKKFNWKDVNVKPLEDIEVLVDAVEDAGGNRPSKMLTSRKILRSICSKESVKKAVFGTNSDRIVTQAQLNDLLSQMNLPTIVTNEEKYRVETAKGYETRRYYPDNALTVFGDGLLGETIYGLTPEEIKLIGDGKMDVAQMIDNIFVGSYSTIDPVATYTKAAATVLPSMPQAEEIGIATVEL